MEGSGGGVAGARGSQGEGEDSPSCSGQRTRRLGSVSVTASDPEWKAGTVEAEAGVRQWGVATGAVPKNIVSEPVPHRRPAAEASITASALAAARRAGEWMDTAGEGIEAQLARVVGLGGA
eukprot:scaffold34060_cov39-Isochrysis_galbana.AAC.1